MYRAQSHQEISHACYTGFVFFTFDSSSSISNSIMDLSIKYSLPIANGVLNCLNKKQAKLRSSSKKNKGAEAAKALLSVLKYLK